MISGRRIVHNVSTAVKQRRGIGIGIAQWSGREMAISPRRFGLSSAIKSRLLSTAVKQWRGIPQWPSYEIRCFQNRFTRHGYDEVGYTVDVADLLFTPERDFLLRNNAQKIKVDDLRGKTIVLFIAPLDSRMHVTRPGAGDTWDMINAYSELQSIGVSDVEFVFVPLRGRSGSVDDGEEAVFRDLHSTMPFPAIPFSDAQPPEGPVVQTFSLDDLQMSRIADLPYWVVIDPTNTVVATSYLDNCLFKLFGGAELHPLSRERIEDLYASYESEPYVSELDELLASDTRDFLLSSNGDKVPISSLKGKLVGLYFCENIPHPPRIQAIKAVYEEAKSRGYDFEIVQITFHYHPFNARYRGADPTVQQRCEDDVSWLTLPFKDPSCRKLHRILPCVEEDDYNDTKHWVGDSLILIHPDNGSGVLLELSGAQILKRWGIQGYPFTRQSLYKAEYEIQKRDVTLESIFPPEECPLLRPRPGGDGFDLVDAFSQLSGKRVLVFFAEHSGGRCDCGGSFVSTLKSEYEAQVEDDVAEESKFEVVYVPIEGTVSSFKEFTKDMPWLVRPSSSEDRDLFSEVFKVNASGPCAAAFNEQGELIAKASNLEEVDKLQFPFIGQDLEKFIRKEVEAMCYQTDCESAYCYRG